MSANYNKTTTAPSAQPRRRDVHSSKSNSKSNNNNNNNNNNNSNNSNNNNNSNSNNSTPAIPYGCREWTG